MADQQAAFGSAACSAATDILPRPSAAAQDAPASNATHFLETVERYSSRDVELSNLSEIGVVGIPNRQLDSACTYDQSPPRRSPCSPVRHPTSSASAADAAAADAHDSPCFELLPLSEQLAASVAQAAALAAALHKKELECDHMRSIIKELSVSRSSIARAKGDLQERFVALQTEIVKVHKVSELARVVAKQNLGKAAAAKKELRLTQDELHLSKQHVAALREKSSRLKAENAELKQRTALLERRQLLDDCRHSVCMREFTCARHLDTY